MKAFPIWFFCLLLIASFPVSADEVHLTPKQLIEVKKRLEEDAEDYTQYGFSNKEKEEYYELVVFLEEVINKDNLSENEEKAFERWDILSDKLHAAQNRKLEEEQRKQEEIQRKIEAYNKLNEQLLSIQKALSGAHGSNQEPVK